VIAIARIHGDLNSQPSLGVLTQGSVEFPLKGRSSLDKTFSLSHCRLLLLDLKVGSIMMVDLIDLSQDIDLGLGLCSWDSLHGYISGALRSRVILIWYKRTVSSPFVSVKPLGGEILG
jgi:hypothetical protein